MRSATTADNVELFAQGIANIASPSFGGLPATGAIARTATNVRPGAKTPVAGIIHVVTLAVILLVAAPLAAAVPMAVVAAILLVVAYNMGGVEGDPAALETWVDRSRGVDGDLRADGARRSDKELPDYVSTSASTVRFCSAPPTS